MEKIIIIAMFVQVTLSLVVMVIMGKRRFAAAKNKHIQLSDFAAMRLDNAGDHVRVADRNFSNQFEIPVLFYAGCLLALQLNMASVSIAVLACIFVATRIIHSLIHLGSNHLRARFRVFLLGCLSVFVMWFLLLLGVLLN
ncbi:MAPEG family protein [Pseudoalteromonas sp. APC 3218]|uniref:MAPEG family protein n=1 Tax=Pseudoalteromonas sp. APC 3218 TaxID=3035180 RepID=UPI0025B315B0|nr:MAPEG family protein [Pseudoalteromonas sp. APC 3218]MDN3406297.1 MAPEG family protein [Pseudoalteromonas sp. APC 3218]|tara:strand:- start:69 stop:488 length:420 start_codon:yes stop_codon:yes gene_type:complete